MYVVELRYTRGGDGRYVARVVVAGVLTGVDFIPFFNKLQTQEVAPFVYFIRQTSSQPAERGSWIAGAQAAHISPDLASCVIDATSGSHDTYLK